MADLEQRDPRWEKARAAVGTRVSEESGRQYFYADIYLGRSKYQFLGVSEFMDDRIYIDDWTAYPQDVLDDVVAFRELWGHMVSMADRFLDIRDKVE